MKRDFDLIREILLRVEQVDPEEPYIFRWEIDGYSEPVVLEHVKLLIDAGYVEGNYELSTAYHVMGTIVSRLTMKGHDFLDTMRDDTVWNRTKSKIQKATGTTSLEIVKEVAASIARTMILGS